MVWARSFGCLALGLMVGCGGGIQPPKRILMPEAKVESVRLVEAGPEATRLAMQVVVVNRNDTALPVTDARYQLTVGKQTYTTRTEPNVTVPAEGHIAFELPAVFQGPIKPNAAWRAKGTLELKPLRTFEQLFLGLFRLRPSARLEGSGWLEGRGDG